MATVLTEHEDQTPHMSLGEIIGRCDAIDNEAAREIAQAAKKLMQPSQKEIRSLCSAWKVIRRDGKKCEPQGRVLRAELQAKLAKRVREL